MSDPAAAPSAQFRDRLLQGVLAHAGALGWGRAGLAAGAQEAGLSEGEALLAAPNGGADLIDALALWGDERMAEALSGLNLASMKIRARVRAAVRARLMAIEPHRPAVRRSIQYLALTRPQQIPAMAWRTADRIWTALGDASTDGNFYSKRAILAGVYAATLSRFLEDETPGAESTWAFLDDRIDNVMQFEKLKAQAQTLALGPDALLAVLTRLRYGRRPG